MMYPDPTWHVGSLEHLRLLLQFCAGARRPGWSSTFQRLELTVPVGMDDGNAVIRLTVAGPPLLVPVPEAAYAVVVYAEAGRFGVTFDPPQYQGDAPPARRRGVIPSLTTSIADYLSAQLGATSPEPVGDGSLRFILDEAAFQRAISGLA